MFSLSQLNDYRHRNSMLLSGDFLSCICRLYITDALQSEPGENIGALLAQRD